MGICAGPAEPLYESRVSRSQSVCPLTRAIGGSRCLLRSDLVLTVLVKNQAGHLAVVAAETDLPVHHFEEELVLLFREQFESRLSGGLSIKVLPIGGDLDGKGGREN